jgi:hypothetical protein
MTKTIPVGLFALVAIVLAYLAFFGPENVNSSRQLELQNGENLYAPHAVHYRPSRTVNAEKFRGYFRGYVHITYARPRGGTGRVHQVPNGTDFSDEVLAEFERIGAKPLRVNGKEIILDKPIQTASPAARPEGPRRYNPRKPGPGDLMIPTAKPVEVAVR